MNRITFLKIQPATGPKDAQQPCMQHVLCAGRQTHEVIIGTTETLSNGDKAGSNLTRKGCLDHCRELAARELGRLEP